MKPDPNSMKQALQKTMQFSAHLETLVVHLDTLS
jgi:hypothetical protein